MKKLLLLLTFLPILVSAKKVEIGGIWYNLIENSHEAEVTYGNWEPLDINKKERDGRYSGDIVIPTSIEYDGTIWNVKSIGGKVFSFCPSLTSISLPYGLVSIGVNTFSGCISLKTITIPETVNRIGELAFEGCTGLTKVNISDLKAWLNIQFGAVDGNPLWCAKHLYLNGVEIKDLVIPDGVVTIGYCAFAGCEGLTSVKIPNSVISIGGGAFSGCNEITEINIPNSVTSIGVSAFRNCRAIASIAIPNSVTSIGRSAFYGCSSITSITIPSNVPFIHMFTFYECNALTSITIPNSVTSIGPNAFYGCSALTSITIPNSLTSIGDYAFEGCRALTSIIIPNNVKYIGERAFAKCYELKDVYCLAEALTSVDRYEEQQQLYADYSAFQDSYPQYMTLHVPATSIEAYRSSWLWSKFGNIVALTDENLKPMGITEVRVPMNDDDTYYDLFGRKVIPTQKGIYIHKGEKLLIK